MLITNPETYLLLLWPLLERRVGTTYPSSLVFLQRGVLLDMDRVL